jgi:hypothetical protein
MSDPSPFTPTTPAAAPEDDGFVDRRWSVPKDVWDQILEMAAQTGINYAELVVMLLEDGIKVRMRIPVEQARGQKPAVPWSVVHVELGNKLLGRLNMRQVPGPDEVLTIDGKSYLVTQRAWQVVKGLASAYIRVEAFEAA